MPARRNSLVESVEDSLRRYLAPPPPEELDQVQIQVFFWVWFVGCGLLFCVKFY